MSYVVVLPERGLRKWLCRNSLVAAAVLSLSATACSGAVASRESPDQDPSNVDGEDGEDAGDDMGGSMSGGSSDDGGTASDDGGSAGGSGGTPGGSADGGGTGTRDASTGVRQDAGGTQDAGTPGGGTPGGGSSDAAVPACTPVRGSGGSGGTAGQWTKISIPVGLGDCGAQTMLVDPVRPSDFYALVCATGGSVATLKSTDYGQTFKRVDKTGFAGNPTAGAIDPNPCRDPNTPPTLYSTALYGELGLWKSTDGGANWKQMINGDKGSVPGLACSNYWPPDFYSVAILADDPPNHILVSYHAGGWSCPGDGIIESFDGGKTFLEHKGPGDFGSSHYFVIADQQTWILSDEEGVWRTTSAGRVNGQLSPNAWKKVDAVGHTHGSFTAARSGNTIYMPSFRGIFRSTDKGATWTNVYSGAADAVIATEKFLYSSNYVEPALKRSTMTSDSTWSNYTTQPGAMDTGPSPHGAIASFDGKNWILMSANDGAGLWRYVEP